MRFSSKKELLESIRATHEEFVALAATIPATRYGEKGVGGDDWTVKDLFAHLTEWERMFLGWYRCGLAGEKPALPAAGYKWSQMPQLNRDIWRKHRANGWKRVREDFDASHLEILALAESLTQGQLLSPGRFGWTGKLPLSSYLAPCSCSHYRTATKFLKRWQRGKR